MKIKAGLLCVMALCIQPCNEICVIRYFRVDENAWNDVQQEPAKKAKSDAVILQIDPTDNLAASNSTASGQNGNGHQNGHQNGHNVDAKNGSNGDAENGHTEDNWTLTGHLDDDVNGLLDDEIGKLEVENSLGTEEVIGLEVEEVVELETEDVPDAKKDQKETVEPQISQNLENKGEDAGSLKQQVGFIIYNIHFIVILIDLYKISEFKLKDSQKGNMGPTQAQCY